MLTYVEYIVMVATVVFFYRLGESEYRCGWPLAVVSVTLWLIAPWGLVGAAGSQVLLFACLFAVNAVRSRQ